MLKYIQETHFARKDTYVFIKFWEGWGELDQKWNDVNTPDVSCISTYKNKDALIHMYKAGIRE